MKITREITLLGNISKYHDILCQREGWRGYIRKIYFGNKIWTVYGKHKTELFLYGIYTCLKVLHEEKT